MNVFEWLTTIFRKLLPGTRADPAEGNPDVEAEDGKMGSGGLESRCINPDIGCPFEVS
jgi:hypothetical protein